MEREKRRKALGLLIVVLIIVTSCSPQFRGVMSIPTHLRVLAGQPQYFDLNFPITVNVRTDKDGILKLNGNPVYNKGYQVNLASPVALEPVDPGKVNLEFRLFGLIPLRKIVVDVLPSVEVVPGGHSIGVLLRSQGVIVVGSAPVKSMDNRECNPAMEAGMAVGDTILKINGQVVNSDAQVAELIDQAGKNGGDVLLTVKRDGKLLEIKVNPVLCKETKRYRIGLYIRDTTAGVGTLTFYDPKSKRYGALGHVITDADTNQAITIEDGKIVQASVSGIQLGKRGQPGEKIGTFMEESDVVGNIEKNTKFGIYGNLEKDSLANSIYTQPIPIALMNQVKPGPAEILTVIDDQTIERFQIEIQRVIKQETPDTKGMVIKVTDKRLLEKTGGIIQGMSGSPIIQDGKLVGAVTHVFVNDPTRGYAVFIEWMIIEAGINQEKQAQTTARNFQKISGCCLINRKFIL